MRNGCPVSDAPDANPGDGICASTDPSGTCTIRAAVEEGNALGRANIIYLGPSIFNSGSTNGPLVVTGRLSLTVENTSIAAVRGDFVIESGGSLVARRVEGQAGRFTIASSSFVVRGVLVLDQSEASVNVEESGILVAQNSVVRDLANEGHSYLRHVTLTSDPAIANGPTGVVHVSSSLITDPLGSTGNLCTGPLPVSGGYNLSTGTCGLTAPGDLENASFGQAWFLSIHEPDGDALDRIPVGVNGCGTEVTTDYLGRVRPTAYTAETAVCDVGPMERPTP